MTINPIFGNSTHDLLIRYTASVALWCLADVFYDS